MSVRWRTLGGPDDKAHLLDERALGITAWCGFDLSKGQDAGFRQRCADCVRLVRKFAADATAPPPQRVTEVFRVSVTRNASGGSDTAQTIVRKLAAMRSWAVRVDLVSTIEESDE